MLQNNKIKILHIIPPVQYGGGESVIKDIILNSKEEIDSVVLLLCRSQKFEIKLTDSKINFVFFNFKELPASTKILNFIILFIKIILTFSLKKCNVDKYNILHCHGFPSLFIGFFYKLYNRKIKIIYTHHQQVFISNLLITKLFSFVYKKFDHITFVSHTISNSFCNKFGIKYNNTVIYNPVSSLFINSQTNKIDNVNIDHLKLIYLSRFSKQKAHFDLILSFVNNQLASINNKFVIYFYGDGSEIDACKKLVKDNNLEQNFIFKGFVDQKKLPTDLFYYDLAIFPSFYEGFGVAAAECIASQLPVIYNKVNDTLIEIVGDAGWGIELNDAPFFLNRLTMNDIQSKIEACIFQRNNFKEEVIANKYINLYKSIL